MSANHITLLRIILLPFPCFIFVVFNAWGMLGFFIYLLLAFTDYIDGVFARRYGITDLGSFLDPVADKMMISSVVLLLAEANWILYWIPGILLCRDFFLTNFRTILTVLNKEIRTTNFAKVKTIIQIAGFLAVFLTCILNNELIITTLYVIEFLFWIFVFLKLIKNLSQPFWIIPIFSVLISLNVLFKMFSDEYSIFYQCIFIVLLVWITAVDYIIVNNFLSFKEYLNGRLFWSLLSGIVTIVLCLYSFNISITLLFVFFQLFLVGIDNLLALRRKNIKSCTFVIFSIVIILFSLLQNQSIFIIMVFGVLIYCAFVIKKFKHELIFIS